MDSTLSSATGGASPVKSGTSPIKSGASRIKSGASPAESGSSPTTSGDKTATAAERDAASADRASEARASNENVSGTRHHRHHNHNHSYSRPFSSLINLPASPVRVPIRESIALQHYSPVLEEARTVRLLKQAEEQNGSSRELCKTKHRTDEKASHSDNRANRRFIIIGSQAKPMNQAKESRRQLEGVLAQLQDLRRSTSSQRSSLGISPVHGSPALNDGGDVSSYSGRSSIDIKEVERITSSNESFRTAPSRETGNRSSGVSCKRESSALSFVFEDTNVTSQSGLSNNDDAHAANPARDSSTNPKISASSSNRTISLANRPSRNRDSLILSTKTPAPVSPLPPLPHMVTGHTSPLHLRNVAKAEPRLISADSLQKHQSIRASTSTMSYPTSSDLSIVLSEHQGPQNHHSYNLGRSQTHGNDGRRIAREEAIAALEAASNDVVDLNIPPRSSSHRPFSMSDVNRQAGNIVEVPERNQLREDPRLPPVHLQRHHRSSKPRPHTSYIPNEPSANDDMPPMRKLPAQPKSHSTLSHQSHRTSSHSHHHHHHHHQHHHHHRQSHGQSHNPEMKRKSKMRPALSLGSEQMARKSGAFSQANIQRLLELTDSSLQLHQLDIPPEELKLLDKFVNALSKLSVEINHDDRKRREGKRRLHNALRAIEGWI